MKMMSTHTYVVLDISPAAHAEIKAKLLAGGYQHAIDGDTIDMHGIALEPSCKLCVPSPCVHLEGQRYWGSDQG